MRLAAQGVSVKLGIYSLSLKEASDLEISRMERYGFNFFNFSFPLPCSINVLFLDF
jgi:hypothetical protein